MVSDVYMRSTEEVAKSLAKAPDNKNYWRFDRQRMDAEQIRDTLLTLSNELIKGPGGRHPFNHHLTYFYRQHEPFVGPFETYRRTGYQMQQRFVKNDYLDLFDGPDGNIQMSERKVTTTTLQALFMMNSDFIHERSQVIANRILLEASSEFGRIQKAYQLLFGRQPTRQETIHLNASVHTLTQSSDEASAWRSVVRSMISSNEFLHLD